MKAVIPAAGFGTRFLPFTKSVPKELIPIVDKPVIQYVVEEAVASGAEEILIIISSGKEAICRHFNPEFELEQRLEASCKTARLEELRSIGRGASIHYIYQKELDGLGGALRYARSFVGNEPFAVLLGDNVTSGERPMLSELLEVYREKKASVVAVEEVPTERVRRYGVIDGVTQDRLLYRLRDLVEKPDPSAAPSNLAIASRYVFTPAIFEELEQTPRGKNNEVQLTDAMRRLVKREEMYALKVRGKRYDAGDKLSFLLTTLEFALKRPEYRDVLLEFMRKELNR
ncbi:MAG: UTP--glucose-1-phosphate uridylyltransferase [Lentisphaerae bacterium ADurb.Bin242]|nr:MAG: UTP--glucose-1-phosphate uridylyltransferase [Lentisphaerae bacterium ADurb.Bin242]